MAVINGATCGLQHVFLRLGACEVATTRNLDHDATQKCI
jgi:hypothetical protein